jgi:arylsulfatase A-like enzyme
VRSLPLLSDAVNLIGAQGTKTPFFLYLAFNAPHAPYQAPQADLDRYQAIPDPRRRAYAAQITAMDSQIGRVVTALDERKMRDDTLIVFQSDNGWTRNPMFAGEGDMSKIKTPVDNGPYRDGKGSLCLISKPARCQPKRRLADFFNDIGAKQTLVSVKRMS